jgi:hypothetical protein
MRLYTDTQIDQVLSAIQYLKYELDATNDTQIDQVLSAIQYLKYELDATNLNDDNRRINLNRTVSNIECLLNQGDVILFKTLRIAKIEVTEEKERESTK